MVWLNNGGHWLYRTKEYDRRYKNGAYEEKDLCISFRALFLKHVNKTDDKRKKVNAD